MADLHKTACNEIDALADALNDLSQDIWKAPELKMKEVHAHRVLTDFLENRGLSVDRHFVLDTGFRSVVGSASEGPHVAILCEYDALPGIGHGCGHNLIAEVGIAASLGVHAAIKASGTPLGKLTILGTPGEEGGGGKIDMINAKIFDDVDVAMMAHPAPFDAKSIMWLAFDSVKVTYHGKAAHGTAFPFHGVNALDAAVLCYQSVACMRQQCKPDWRVMGIISNGGNEAGVITELSELQFYAFAQTKLDLETLRKKLDGCFNSAATATGCTVDISWGDHTYYDVINNQVMADLYFKHAKSVGIDFEAHGSAELPGAATDMGNVSYVVPSIHPLFYIGASVFNHTREFTEVSGDAKAQPYTLAVAKALAMTAIDVFTQPETLRSIKDEFNNSVSLDSTNM